MKIVILACKGSSKTHKQIEQINSLSTLSMNNSTGIPIVCDSLV